MSTARGQGRGPAWRAPLRRGIPSDPPRSGLGLQSLSSGPDPGQPRSARASPGGPDPCTTPAPTPGRSAPPWQLRRDATVTSARGARGGSKARGHAPGTLCAGAAATLCPWAGPLSAAGSGSVRSLVVCTCALSRACAPRRPGPRSPLPSAPRRLVFSKLTVFQPISKRKHQPVCSGSRADFSFQLLCFTLSALSARL